MRLLRSLVVSGLLLTFRPVLGAGDQVAEVTSWLTGTFDTKEQAQRDPDFQDLRMVSVVVPKSRLGADGPVLYVEQALASTPDKPYRQRFYRIEDGGAGKVLVRVFEPKDKIAVSGKWRDPSDLAVFTVSDVIERAGCLVAMRKSGDHYEGGTEGLGCPSALSGALYATSRTALYDGRLESLDRGFDARDKQVWGAAKGPNVFVRRSFVPPSLVAPTPVAVSFTPKKEPGGLTMVPGTVPTAVPAMVPATPTPISTAPRASSFPAGLQAPSLALTGAATERSFTASDLRGLPQSEVRSEQPDPDRKKKVVTTVTRGVALAELLRRAGLQTEGMAALRLLAPAVLVARASDGYTAVFAVEELVTPGQAPILVYEEDGLPLRPGMGPFRILCPTSRVRSLRQVESLEFRLLANNTEKEEPPPVRATPSEFPLK